MYLVAVVSRWYGRVGLAGGDRVQVIWSVGRDAVVRLLGELGQNEREEDAKGRG